MIVRKKPTNLLRKCAKQAKKKKSKPYRKVLFSINAARKKTATEKYVPKPRKKLTAPVRTDRLRP